MDKIRLEIVGLSEIVGLEDIALLVLVDITKTRQLIVPCEKSMRKEIQKCLLDKPDLVNRCLGVTSKILKDQICDFEVVITRVEDGMYLAEVRERLSGKVYPIRCSDGVLFSQINDCPLYATRDVMQLESVPYQPGSSKVALPINIITNEMLQTSLNKAIETENYEMASQLRDELIKRKNHKEGA